MINKTIGEIKEWQAPFYIFSTKKMVLWIITLIGMISVFKIILAYVLNTDILNTCRQKFSLTFYNFTDRQKNHGNSVKAHCHL